MVPAAICEMGLTKIWDAVAKRGCSNSIVEALPPMVCQLVENKALESKAVDAVCSKQSKVATATCEAVLVKIWDALAEKACPSDSMMALPPLMCNLIENDALETKSLNFACSKQAIVPAATCETGL